LEARVRKCFDVIGLELAGVVHQECQRAKRRGRWNESTHRLVVGKVAKHDTGTAACSRDRGRESLRVLARMMCVQHNRIPCPSKRERGGRANAAARPSDERRARRVLRYFFRHSKKSVRRSARSRACTRRYSKCGLTKNKGSLGIPITGP